jgi:hypothetical protein
MEEGGEPALLNENLICRNHSHFNTIKYYIDLIFTKKLSCCRQVISENKKIRNEKKKILGF